jgi:predicted RNase H-like HicB family nuclease
MSTSESLRIPVELVALVHDVVGGGYWAEVPALPGCVASADTKDDLRENLIQAIQDWMAETSGPTEEELKSLAEIQAQSPPVAVLQRLAEIQKPPQAWYDEDE